MNRNMMQQIQQLQAKMEKIQHELEQTPLEASSGGGVVTVVINGQQKIESVKISPEAVDPNDVAMLQDLVVSAVNEAIRKSKELAASRMGALTGGIKIPGLM